MVTRGGGGGDLPTLTCLFEMVYPLSLLLREWVGGGGGEEEEEEEAVVHTSFILHVCFFSCAREEGKEEGRERDHLPTHPPTHPPTSYCVHTKPMRGGGGGRGGGGRRRRSSTCT